MKKILSLALVIVLLASGLFVLTGCGNGNENDAIDGEMESNENQPKVEGVEISRELRDGIVTLTVPKNEDGTPKYEFTTEEPEGISKEGSFYLVTDTATFSFGTSSFVYNTGVEYKDKYGEKEGSFAGYLEFIEDTSLSSRPKLENEGLEKLDLNGRNAIRYYSRSGSSNNYTYYGYFYKVDVDDIYSGSGFDMTVNYKGETPSEAKEFDQDTLDIINSLIIK